MFFYNMKKEKSEAKGLSELNIITNHERISRTMSVLVLAIFASTTGVVASGRGSEGVTMGHIGIAFLAMLAIMTVSYLVLRTNYLKGWSKYVMAVSILLMILVCRLTSPSHETFSMLYIIAMLILLYNDVKLSIFSCSIIFISDILLLSFNEVHRLPGSSDYAIRYFTVLFVAIASFSGSKGTQNLFTLAERKEREVKEAKGLLEETFEQVKKTVLVLKDNTSAVKNEVAITKSGSDSIAESFHQISSGIDHSAHDVVKITDFTVKSNQSLEKATSLSIRIGQEFNQTAESVNEGTGEINAMANQMAVVHSTMQSVTHTVEDLKSKMKAIDGFLSSIIGIAEQTNLLSLNAAIEAARAGEQGKGFAVVADEIRKLADNASRTANEIQGITLAIQKTADIAMSEVSEGSKAVTEGKDKLSSVQNKFHTIAATVDQINTDLTAEIELISQTRVQFHDVQAKLENLSAVFEEHTATSQEVLSVVTLQTGTMRDILGQIENIDTMSERLKDISHF